MEDPSIIKSKVKVDWWNLAYPYRYFTVKIYELTSNKECEYSWHLGGRLI